MSSFFLDFELKSQLPVFDVEVVTVSNRLLLFVNFANSQSFVLIIFLRIF